MERKKISYDVEADSLIISNRQENDLVSMSYEVGDIVFSLTKRGKIASIEIKEFSSFLESCNIASTLAGSISNAELKIVPRKDTIFLVLKMEFGKEGVTVSKNIPLIMPLINQ